MSNVAVLPLAKAAKAAARVLAASSRAAKDAALANTSVALREAARPESPVLRANAADVDAARTDGLAAAMADRLMLNPARLHAMAEAVDEVRRAADPIGEIVHAGVRPNGLLVGQVRAPLGVIAMIYESRPNVTIEAFSLALKSGNAVLLRGGKEAARTNASLGELGSSALEAAGLPTSALTVIPPTDRESIRELVSLTEWVDLAIPRGGEGLIRFVTEHARVPVIQHYKGVCHVYVDEGADLEMARAIVENAKLSRVSVCNALECLLVHRAEAERFLPSVGDLRMRGLELRADDAARRHVPEAKPATEEDWGAEFLEAILAVRVVDDFDGALAHIARYGSRHTEAIITRDLHRAKRFQREVDASCVIVNASTRFNDGGELGLGAEMGISTSKLHAYGPMGLVHLTTLKWFIEGNGQVRSS